MKSRFKIVGILTVFTFFMMNCASSQFESQLPFSIEKAIYSIDNQLYNVKIESNQKITSVPTVVYFRDKFSSAIKVEGNQLNIIIPRKTIGNLVMHKDPKKEYGNTLQTNDNKKFTLEENEIVLGFGSEGSIKFYKIIGTHEIK